MPLSEPVRVVRELTSHGYNADREAVTLLADAPDPDAAVARAVETAPDDVLTLTAEHVREALDDIHDADGADTDTPSDTASSPDTDAPPDTDDLDTTVSSGDETTGNPTRMTTSPAETKGDSFDRTVDEALREVDIAGDITGRSTGTGEYEDFVAVFRDRYERLSKKLRGRVNHRPTDALEQMSGGNDAAVVGMVNDIRSTASGHWLVELEDTNGTFPALVMKDRDIAELVDEMLLDEVVAVEGSLSSDGGIIFADNIHFPDVPRNHQVNTADRHVQAALVSDVHVGSQEFAGEAWSRFTSWLHTREAEHVEYLLIAGDMVEGVGVYPDQDEELDIVDIYEQYEAFSERLKEVPGDVEIVLIPGNHDAVRLAEPQPGFDEKLRDIMDVHDPHISGNPSTVTVEGVDVLMYHGVSIDEMVAELPEDKASYEKPHRAMYQLLKKRHVAPQFGGHMRVAPEEKDYLVIDDVPDVFHTGHVHKLGIGTYHNVRCINSGCWQKQTDFQKSVNIQPDVATAPILDLDTLEVTVRKFE
ncbi:DNA-directed DNA polymerase II small subunit [Halospeciosus flavus]|uniref:DNA polymerase II small subunit n=1 Tax=Halospeciosus flavus TaxID=3032283 RepID=A0ABD5Z716_9EURY|nr:DNA-directed DNA polymerase II small subunit [Halospeciosus flavus]